MQYFIKVLSPYKGLPKEIYILFISKVINSLGTFVYPLLALILTQKIGLTKVQAGTYVTILAISQIPSLLLGGKLVDTFGRKKIIFIFQSLGAISYLLCGFLEPNMIMAFMIVLASCFYTVASSALEAVTADLTTPENRKSSYSLLYMGHNLGFAIGPILAGLLYKKYLSLIFIGDAITTIISITLFVVFIKETMKKKPQIEEIATAIENKNNLEKHEEGSALSILLKRPILLYFALIMFIYQFAYSQWGFTLPLRMGDIFSEDGAKFYGLIAGFNGLIVIIFTPLLTSLLQKTNAIKAIAFGGIFYGVAFGLIGFIKFLPMFFLSIFIMTIGEIMVSINTGTFIANHTPASHRGRINSILPLIIGAGFTLGPIVMGKVMDSYGNTITWSCISISVFIGAFLMGILAKKDKQSF